MHYKKKYEQTKAQYHLVVDTAEQRHHKENAVLHSQVPFYVMGRFLTLFKAVTTPRAPKSQLSVLVKVKYREEFERNKGSSQMEFGDTEAYRVSKEAQKMQSGVKKGHFSFNEAASGQPASACFISQLV